MSLTRVYIIIEIVSLFFLTSLFDVTDTFQPSSSVLSLHAVIYTAYTQYKRETVSFTRRRLPAISVDVVYQLIMLLSTIYCLHESRRVKTDR